MRLSAHDALKQSRTDIEAIRNARGSKQTVLRHYRAAKIALDKVDNMETDTESLREMIIAFQDLAETLDRLGELEKADKCRQRANALRPALDGRMRVYAAAVAPSLMGSGFSPAIHAGVIQLHSIGAVSLSSCSISSTWP